MFSHEFGQLSAERLDIWRGGSDERHSAPVLSRTPHRLKSNRMRRQYRPVTSSANQKTLAAPPPLTQHLSPLRTERLSFLFALSYYYYQGNFEVAR